MRLIPFEEDIEPITHLKYIRKSMECIKNAEENYRLGLEIMRYTTPFYDIRFFGNGVLEIKDTTFGIKQQNTYLNNDLIILHSLSETFDSLSEQVKLCEKCLDYVRGHKEFGNIDIQINNFDYHQTKLNHGGIFSKYDTHVVLRNNNKLGVKLYVTEENYVIASWNGKQKEIGTGYDYSNFTHHLDTILFKKE